MAPEGDRGFPELRRELEDDQGIFSINSVWFTLLPLVRKAHRVADDDLLDRVHAFADWCNSKPGDPSNAVAVSFHEHLMDERWMRPLVVARLPVGLLRDLRGLWQARLPKADMAEVDELLRNRGMKA